MKTDQPKFLRVNHLSHYFGAVPALVDVNFALASGEVLGVVGQRGAGKSTLFRLLGGVYTPSAGEIILDGNPVALKSAARAQRLGITAVQQAPQLINEMDVAHNVFLGREIRAPGWLRLLPEDGEMLTIARDLLASFEMSPDFFRKCAANLSDEQRQVVALARAFCRPSRLLLLDDALEALSFVRQEKLLEWIAALKSQQVAVILSSDDLEHIFSVTDRILVLYQGQQLALRRTTETTPREIVELIVGSKRQARVTPVIWAFENYHRAQQQAEKLRQDQLALRQSLEEKDSLNRQLIERLNNQLEALDGLNLALQEAGRRLISEREAERKVLARELHDQIIQDLLSYNYQLEEAENAPQIQHLELAQIRQGIRQVVGSLRQVCSDLRPPTIDNHGLSAAIRSLVGQWTTRSGIAVKLDIASDLGRLPEPIELSVFRIVQEGLRNVQKHASATQVRLSLQRTDVAGLVVRLSDNGYGMGDPVDLAALTEQKHFGLVGISERVSLLSGSLIVRTSSTGGLELEIEIPSPYPSAHK
ncbi:MAG: ATP-binding cassette domain-containing protein [Chloroflexota bacterium]|nr:ATP-binding cassette domain-containing protein [Chloroflexota bacterium]